MATTRGMWRRRISIGAVLLAPASIAVVVVVLLLASPGGVTVATHGHRALLVDQLAATNPDPGFIDDARATLTVAGYQVDYVPQEAVTVDFYRQLPTMGYDLIVLRSHAASYGQDTSGATSDAFRSVALFTNQPYDPRKYVDAQRARNLSSAAYAEGADEQQFFALDSRFVDAIMQGRFAGSTIVLMGCNGLSSPVLADAFLHRGAAHFVSWSDSVTAQFTDRATAALLRHFTSDTPDIGTAAAVTMAQLGADPAFGSRLVAYP